MVVVVVVVVVVSVVFVAVVVLAAAATAEPLFLFYCSSRVDPAGFGVVVLESYPVQSVSMLWGKNEAGRYFFSRLGGDASEGRHRRSEKVGVVCKIEQP